jgi:hypothetical protein
METRHPDLDAIRIRLRAGLPRVADLPELKIPPPPGPWSSGGVRRGRVPAPIWLTIAACWAPVALLILVAIGAWAAMP